MNIPRKYIWIKFIPLVGIIFAVIDSSHDGMIWERIYPLYQGIWLAILVVKIF